MMDLILYARQNQTACCGAEKPSLKLASHRLCFARRDPHSAKQFQVDVAQLDYTISLDDRNILHNSLHRIMFLVPMRCLTRDRNLELVIFLYGESHKPHNPRTN